MMPFSSPSPDFRSVLSFKTLLAFWKSKEDSPDPGTAALARSFAALNPEKLPLEGPQAEALFSALFPPATFEQDIGAIVEPFSFGALFSTPRFRSLMNQTDHEVGHKVKDRHQTLVAFYRFALSQIYGLNLGPLPSHVFEIELDGVLHFFRASLDLSFCRVETSEALPPLTEEFKLVLLEASNDPGRLCALLPLSLFTVKGFGVLRVSDVTVPETVSRLKLLLIEADSITDPERYAKIQGLVRATLGKSDIELFLAAYRDDQVLMLHQGFQAEQHCILMASQHFSAKDFHGTVFGDTYEQARPFFFPSLSSGFGDHQMKTLFESGVRSLVTAPLTIGEKQVGLVALTSDAPMRLHPGDLDSLQEILPLLALGVRRSVEDLDRRVQQLIQKNFTSIHPSVAWKFQREAARAMLDQRPTLDEIVFENVWPLYAASDIRDSSTHRSQAILADLKDQLDQGHQIVSAARAALALPLLDELDWRIQGQKDILNDGLNAGDEISVLNFLRRELEPTFTELGKAGSLVQDLIDRYQGNVHPEARSVYRRRKDFDDSVRMMNEAVAGLLDREQAEAQLQFPHYFDKNTTDGVDQNIYVGPSLMADGSWDPFYLKNLKLWQFLTLCRIARLTHTLKPKLPVPLDLTHLIMVQDLPITIRFRADEKRFTVDGAYNVRYEIMKKRIDKAVVKGTGERLTQPLTISVVYSQTEESKDYRRFIEYLTAEDWLEPGIEELELEDLQGIHGLKALRVAVKVEPVPVPMTKQIGGRTARKRVGQG
jgi:hypothetical protein